MVQLWHDVDPVEAESSLRGIRRRLADLDAAVQSQQLLLRERPESFALQLGLHAFFDRRKRLREEEAKILIHRVAEPVEVILDGPAFSGHAASLGDLGTVLVRLQRAFTSVAQAITTGPTLRGPIPREISQFTELKLAATFPSSFGMKIFVPTNRDLLGVSLPVETLQQFFLLLRSLQTEEGLMRLTGEVGRRAFVHLSTLANLLRSRESELRLEWKDHAGTKVDWKMGPEGAEVFLSNLKNITETRSETISVSGRLVGASLLKRRFEIITADGTVFDGKYVTGLGDQVERLFGKQVEALVDETEVFDRSTDTSNIYHALLGFEE